MNIGKRVAALEEAATLRAAEECYEALRTFEAAATEAEVEKGYTDYLTQPEEVRAFADELSARVIGVYELLKVPKRDYGAIRSVCRPIAPLYYLAPHVPASVVLRAITDHLHDKFPPEAAGTTG